MATKNAGCGCGRKGAKTSTTPEPATMGSNKMREARITPGLINRKVTLLISAGAAMAGNCEPCLRKIVPQLRDAGASSEEIQWAVLIAQRVKEQPMSIMKAVADELTGTQLSAQPVDETCPAEQMEKDTNYKITLLIAAASAMAANCEFCLNKLVPDLIEAGVSETDMQRAVEIGQFIKDKPAEIMKEAADVLTGSSLLKKNIVLEDNPCEPAASTAGCCG